MSVATLAIAHTVIALLFCAFLLGALSPTRELHLVLAVVAAFAWPLTLPALLLTFAWVWFTTPRSSR